MGKFGSRIWGSQPVANWLWSARSSLSKETTRRRPTSPSSSLSQRRSAAENRRLTVDIPAGEAGLRQDSLALCYNIRVLDTAKLVYRMGGLPSARLEEIGDRLAFLLGL